MIMRKNRDDYCIEGVNFDSVYNRNELLVRKMLKQILMEEKLPLTPKDIQDVFALTLNDCPPHYVHPGTVVLHPNMPKHELIGHINRHIALVLNRPKD